MHSSKKFKCNIQYCPKKIQKKYTIDIKGVQKTNPLTYKQKECFERLAK